MAAGKRSPFVALRTDVRKEERVRFIADHAGYNEFEALGRLASMWCWCTDRVLADAPEDSDGYAVPEAVVRRFLGDRGVDAILGGGCDELAMGRRRPDGLIYLRGTSDTVDRLRSARSGAVTGGRSAAGKAGSSAGHGGRGHDGRFVGNRTIHPADGPAGHQLPTGCTPAASSEIPQTTNHKPEEDPPKAPQGGPVGLPGIPVSEGPKRKKRSARPKVDASPAELASVRVILDRLGTVAGVAYRGCDDHVALIVAQLRNGVTEFELRAVVAFCADQWSEKPEMRKYLRPETLFGPSTISRYLDPARAAYADEIARASAQPRLEVVR